MSEDVQAAAPTTAAAATAAAEAAAGTTTTTMDLGLQPAIAVPEYLCLWAWKRRSGFIGQYGSALTIGHVSKWEHRSVVVSGTALLYFEIGKEDAAKPRGAIDLLADHVEIQVAAPDADAPTKHQVDIKAKCAQDRDRPVEWKLCFDEQEDFVKFLGVVNSVLDQAGAFRQKDVDRFEHDFEAGDHIYRWEMIVCPPVIYPIQIHGLVLEAGRNCLVVADFGLTGYGRKDGEDFNHADAAARRDNAILSQWRKLRPNDVTQRLNIVTMTDPMEIRKWTAARYGEDSLFAKAKPNKTFEKFSNMFSSAPSTSADDEHDNGEYASIGPSKSVDRGGGGSSRNPGGGAHHHHHSNNEIDGIPQSDPKEIVLARVNFVLEHMDVLPPYHVFYSNSECIAVWCKTGRWSTLQAAVFLSTNSVGALKSSTIATMGASHCANAFVDGFVVDGISIDFCKNMIRSHAFSLPFPILLYLWRRRRRCQPAAGAGCGDRRADMGIRADGDTSKVERALGRGDSKADGPILVVGAARRLRRGHRKLERFGRPRRRRRRSCTQREELDLLTDLRCITSRLRIVKIQVES